MLSPKSGVFHNLTQSGAVFRPILLQILLSWNGQRRYDWCNCIMNKLGSAQLFLLTLFRRMRHTLAVMTSITGRTFIIEPRKIMQVVYQFVIRCVVPLMFGVVFLSTA